MPLDSHRKLNPGVYKDDDGLWAENVLTRMWVPKGMSSNPEFDTDCDACLMGKSHHTHDNKAFNVSKAFKAGDDP